MRVHPQPKRAKIEVAIRKGVGEGKTGSWRYRGMINNKVLLKSIRKYINYPVINHMKKNKKKNTYFYMLILSHIAV